MTKTQDALDALDKLANIAFVNTSNEKHSVEQHVNIVECIRTALTRLSEIEKAAEEMEKEMELAMEQAGAFSVQSVNRNERCFALPYSFEKSLAAYRKIKGEKE